MLEVVGLRDLNSIIGIALTRLSKTVKGRVSVLKTWRLQLVPGSWGMLGPPLMCLHPAQWASIQRHKCAATAECCEQHPAASSILADRTAVVCGG